MARPERVKPVALVFANRWLKSVSCYCVATCTSAISHSLIASCALCLAVVLDALDLGGAEVFGMGRHQGDRVQPVRHVGFASGGQALQHVAHIGQRQPYVAQCLDGATAAWS